MITTQDLTIAAQRASGMPIRQIATHNGLDKSNISRKLSKPEIKALVERIQTSLIDDTLETSAENIKHAIQQYKKPATTILVTDKKGNTKELPYVDEQIREHGFKASQRMLEATGILPSHTPSVLIQQIFNQSDPAIGEELGQLREFLASKIGKGETVDKAVQDGGCQPIAVDV